MRRGYFNKLENDCSGAIKFLAKFLFWLDFLGIIVVIGWAAVWEEVFPLLYSLIFIFDAMIRTPFLFGFAKIVETSELFGKLITNRKKVK